MKVKSSNKIVWITSWDRRCGIADYSKALWHEVESELTHQSAQGSLISLDEFSTPTDLKKKLASIQPSHIHFQHEYGLYGGKTPPFYWFPKLIRILKKNLPHTFLSATAHTILDPHYQFPLKGRGVEIPLRLFANTFLLNSLHKLWGQDTWGHLDAVMVHSRHQKSILENQGYQKVKVIPHFVQKPRLQGSVSREKDSKIKSILVFGFFTPEKGQDIAIEALSQLPHSIRLILAGGVRRKKDQNYFQHCILKAKSLKVFERIQFTGFIEERALEDLFKSADLVLAPFRETTGSGSLAQALGRGAPLLASDLPLNLEIVEREQNALAFFKAGDSTDCAAKIIELLNQPAVLSLLCRGAERYATACSPPVIAKAICSLILQPQLQNPSVVVGTT